MKVASTFSFAVIVQHTLPMKWVPWAKDPAKRARSFLGILSEKFTFLFRLFKDQQLHTSHLRKSISPSLSPTTSLLFIYNIKRFTSLNYLFFTLPCFLLVLSLFFFLFLPFHLCYPSGIKLKHVFRNKRKWGDRGIKQPSDVVCSGFIGGNNG